jgi:hypothetical protein
MVVTVQGPPTTASGSRNSSEQNGRPGGKEGQKVSFSIKSLIHFSKEPTPISNPTPMPPILLASASAPQASALSPGVILQAPTIAPTRKAAYFHSSPIDTIPNLISSTVIQAQLSHTDHVKILLDLKMLDVSRCCTEGARESVVQGGSMKRAFSPS